MKVVAVCEDRFRDYLLEIFRRHPESGMKIVCFGSWRMGEDRNRSYSGTPVVPISKVSNSIEYDNVLMAGLNTGYLSHMMTAVQEAGLENVLAVRWFDIVNRTDFMDVHGYRKEHVVKMPEGEEKPCLGELQVHVTDSCNLNCKACSHFTPFVHGRHPMDAGIFEKDLENLSRLFSNIYVFHLMGGEPLLEPELCMDMVRLVKNYFPECSLNIITNGTLIGHMKSGFWECIRDNGITVRVSVYPAVVNNVDYIKEVLTDNGIPFLCEISNKIEFDKYMSLTYETDPVENSFRCHGRGCYSLANGKVTKCPGSIYIRYAADELSKYGVSGDWLYAKDAINLEEETDGWQIIKKLMEPCDLCSRCDISNLKKIPWMPVEKDLNLGDWFLDFSNLKIRR